MWLWRVSGVRVEGGRHEGMKGDKAVRGQVGGGGVSGV